MYIVLANDLAYCSRVTTVNFLAGYWGCLVQIRLCTVSACLLHIIKSPNNTLLVYQHEIEENEVFGSYGLSTKEPYKIMLCPSSLVALASLSLLSVHTFPCHRAIHRDFIFCTHMHTHVLHICTSNI